MSASRYTSAHAARVRRRPPTVDPKQHAAAPPLSPTEHRGADGQAHAGIGIGLAIIANVGVIALFSVWVAAVIRLLRGQSRVIRRRRDAPTIGQGPERGSNWRFRWPCSAVSTAFRRRSDSTVLDPSNDCSATMTDSMPQTPVLDLLASMTADSLAASSLDPGSLMLVRLAALVAVDAPPSSYLLNLEAAGKVGLDAESVRGVLAAVAPIVGTARVASATGKIVKALSVAIEIAEEDAQYGK